MPKFKQARVGVRIDMTPMVDVAFLLLTFFMLTTQFKPPEEVQILLPASHSAFKMPESDVMIITVTKEGEIYLGVDSQNLRALLFGEQNRFRAGVGVDKENLPELLVRARTANPKLRTVIKGDKEAPYGRIEDVIQILQKTMITRFNLVTDLDKGV